MRQSVGFSTWHISTPAVKSSEIKSCDTALLVSFGFGLAGLIVASYAFAINFGIERQTDAGDKFGETWGDSKESSITPTVEDLLASDRRSVMCKTLGGAFEGNFTKSLRKDLILASGVIC
jgi:hypothetical protein